MLIIFSRILVCGARLQNGQTGTAKKLVPPNSILLLRSFTPLSQEKSFLFYSMLRYSYINIEKFSLYPYIAF
jgi:hypothetical protein